MSSISPAIGCTSVCHPSICHVRTFINVSPVMGTFILSTWLASAAAPPPGLLKVIHHRPSTLHPFQRANEYLVTLLFHFLLLLLLILIIFVFLMFSNFFVYFLNESLAKLDCWCLQYSIVVIYLFFCYHFRIT
ncbi:hypothetical protein E2C01_065025 [Portunus trituberculatus]|uniref:Uncharacterized protein n=1 Tax=Portunus trituberculatus TaxID=210409 RepID=A0A5B7HPZ7_PORTR|nr:hypothetical protein [Portunus trituberculatus]